jgi:membrane protein DedA with SNARE-associated domain
MEFIQPHLEFLTRHLLATVIAISFVEAAGIPFPSRIVLIIAETLAVDSRQLVALVVVSTVGSVMGDHIPYLAGRLTGPRILVLYCWITLGSAECIDKTVGYFRRFGTAAVLLSRFSASVRLFASALSGCGHIAYWKFVTFDLVGTLVYVTAWLVIGHLVGARAAEILGRHRAARLVAFVGPVALATLIGYRLWQRRRYGSAKADVGRRSTPNRCGGAFLEARKCVRGPRPSLSPALLPSLAARPNRAAPEMHYAFCESPHQEDHTHG